jgi:uncharacterized repeat protein (TIGR01451 family)
MYRNVLKRSVGSSSNVRLGFAVPAATALGRQQVGAYANSLLPSSKFSLGKTVAKVAILLCCVLQLEARATTIALTVTKGCASPIVTNIGSSLTVTGAVCNISSLDLTNVVIVDAGPGLPALATNIIDVLPAGACSNYSFTYTATDCDPNQDTVSVTANDVNGAAVGPVSANATCYLCCPSISIKTLLANFLAGNVCSGSLQDYGPTATNQNNSVFTNGFCYAIIVRNIGHDPLTNIVVTDDKLGALGTFPGPLAVGGTITISNIRSNWTETTTNTSTVTAQCAGTGLNGNGAVTMASTNAVAYQGVVINCSSNLVAECTGGLTPVDYPPVTAFDSDGNALLVTCTPPSGSSFALGVNNVVCGATNSLGSSNACSFTVTIVDTTPPTITCPTNFLVVPTSSGGAVVNYTTNASDICGLASFICSPSSGSLFPNGITTVTCTATDAATNVASCSFDVAVGGADLLISKSSNRGTVKPGQTITYTITVNNLGPATATNTIINDPTPQGTVFLSATNKSGHIITAPSVGSAGTVTWKLSDLAARATSGNSLTVTVLVRGNANIVNTATVTSDTFDPNLANNSSTVTTRRTTK